MTQHADTKGRVEPAESRTFSIVELTVLVAGFGVAGGVISNLKPHPQRVGIEAAVTLLVYLSLGLSLSGPILVSWRERLGRTRPVWGVGESLWFAIGIFAQNVVATIAVGNWLMGELAAVCFLALLFLLPMLYLTGNPRIEARRAPLSWSNLVGLFNMLLWALTVLSLPMLAP